MVAESRAYSAVVAFADDVTGFETTVRYGPWTDLDRANAHVHRMRSRYSPKGPTQVSRNRFVSGRVETSAYVWEPVDGSV